MDIDLNTLRSAVTVLAFACFIGIFLWAWSGRNRARFLEAQQLPFADETRPPAQLPTFRSPDHA
jgi:cytochrome c oxidase cbb3-type subunit 4